MTTTSPMTELGAVNLMLSVIGEAPVNTLQSSGFSDASLAHTVLTEVLQMVQEKGWHFNTEDNYELPVDADGCVYLPKNALRVDAMPTEGLDLVQRGSRLYDKETHSYKINRNVLCSIVFGLSFDEVPTAARYYITIRAARLFQKRVLGSELLERFTAEDEHMAMLALKDQDTDAGDYNLLTGSYDVAMILER